MDTARLLSLKDVARMTGTPEFTLRYWRQNWSKDKVGPPSAKLGRRIVYREADVVAWIDEQFAKAAGS